MQAKLKHAAYALVFVAVGLFIYNKVPAVKRVLGGQ